MALAAAAATGGGSRAGSSTKVLPNPGVERILVTQDEQPVLVASRLAAADDHHPRRDDAARCCARSPSPGSPAACSSRRDAGSRARRSRCAPRWRCSSSPPRSHKLRDLRAFRATLADYRLLPGARGRPAAAGSSWRRGRGRAAARCPRPALGAALGARRCSRVYARRDRREPARAAGATSTAAAPAPTARRPISGGLVARNALLAAVALAALLPVGAAAARLDRRASPSSARRWRWRRCTSRPSSWWPTRRARAPAGGAMTRRAARLERRALGRGRACSPAWWWRWRGRSACSTSGSRRRAR